MLKCDFIFILLLFNVILKRSETVCVRERERETVSVFKHPQPTSHKTKN